ncbi:Rieske (2Fe-2S) protein [Streptomyces sp. NPDC102360]|uniref:Rieske (2Fe-2S) protein n=1 Tax=Streptomyces sp. NPDC102360 TaxID=3366160 RepID=UPI003816B3AF
MRRTASRRSVLVAGAAALAAGCSKYGDEDQSGGGGQGGGSAQTSATSEPAATGSKSTGGGSQKPPAADELTKTSAIPVGGGKVFPAEKVVVTQPAKGDFKAFSAVCTHQGCTVKDVSGGTINCPCHGSKFKVADASVAGGPAPRPLDTRQIKVTGDSITLA